MTDIYTNYGRLISDNLAQVNPNAVEDALVQAGGAMDGAEKLLGEAYSIGEEKDSVRALAIKLTGHETKGKDKNGNDIEFSQTELQQLAQNKYEKVQRSFYSLEQLRQRAHELMMEIIKQIGR